MWSALCGWPEVAGGGRLRAAESASLTVSWRLGLHAESAPRCRLLSALFLVPPPQLPWVRREGGGCLVAELKVNVRRHNGEGPPPPHEGEARFSSPPHDYLGGAAPTINILQRSVWWVQRRHGGLAAGSEALKFFQASTKNPGGHEAVCNVQIQPADPTRFQSSMFAPLCLLQPARLPRCLFSQRFSSPCKTSSPRVQVNARN